MVKNCNKFYKGMCLLPGRYKLQDMETRADWCNVC